MVHISKKPVKAFNLRVKPDGAVHLSVPLNATQHQINAVLYKRKAWIKAQREFFAKFRPQNESKRLVSGEDFYYLGKRYRLKIIQQKKESASLNRGYFVLCVKNKDDFKRKERLMNEWYYDKACEHFFVLVNAYNQRLKQAPVTIKIRTMKSKWGSCNPKSRVITLNLRLIQKPKSCIEYVVLHELLHLICPNHSPKFYKLLKLYMSDYQSKKECLESEM